jgi:hypothetical protein
MALFRATFRCPPKKLVQLLKLTSRSPNRKAGASRAFAL